MNLEVAERILDVVAAIPAGYVSTYGDVAARAGANTPRIVGRVLTDLGEEDLPWHRVLRSDGRCAPHLRDEQLQRLRAEGVAVDGDRVDLRRHRYQG